MLRTDVILEAANLPFYRVKYSCSHEKGSWVLHPEKYETGHVADRAALAMHASYRESKCNSGTVWVTRYFLSHSGDDEFVFGAYTYDTGATRKHMRERLRFREKLIRLYPSSKASVDGNVYTNPRNEYTEIYIYTL